MAQGRIYKASAIYNARIASLRNLWEPSREYQGKPVEKPNYLVTALIKKTRANWYEEPALGDFAKSANELYQAAMSHIPFPQIAWPIKDGDEPDAMGKPPAEWRRGNWVLNGSSTSPIEVGINQGGAVVPLKGPVDVKSGDHVMVSTSIAVSAQNPRGVKCYINRVVFMASGEEIVMGSSVSTAEMMARAKEQGMNVTGFGGGTPQQGFGMGFAPPMGSPVAGQTAPAAAVFPSNSPTPGFAPPPVQPPSQGGGFAAPAGFNAPTGFPPRQ